MKIRVFKFIKKYVYISAVVCRLKQIIRLNQ